MLYRPSYSLYFYLSVLSSWAFLCYSNKAFADYIYIYFYTQIYYFYFLFKRDTARIFFNATSSILTIRTFFYNNFYVLYWVLLKNLFFTFSKLYFIKLTFKGKGYYIYKGFRNTVALRFGYSHRYYLYAYNVSLLFLTKTTVLVFGLNKNDILYFAYSLYKAKPINIFTGRGVRFTRQIIYKKMGKVSSYR